MHIVNYVYQILVKEVAYYNNDKYHRSKPKLNERRTDINRLKDSTETHKVSFDFARCRRTTRFSLPLYLSIKTAAPFG